MTRSRYDAKWFLKAIHCFREVNHCLKVDSEETADLPAFSFDDECNCLLNAGYVRLQLAAISLSSAERQKAEGNSIPGSHVGGVFCQPCPLEPSDSHVIPGPEVYKSAEKTGSVRFLSQASQSWLLTALLQKCTENQSINIQYSQQDSAVSQMRGKKKVLCFALYSFKWQIILFDMSERSKHYSAV